MDETIIKRIHISGLTPAITAKDISDRLASFGTVKAIDGFGKLDAVEQPRKFAYATLETTKGKLARCMNLLSGVTWKGAKLRLGEAKPDFRERIAQEKASLKRESDAAEEESLKKRRRLARGVQGVHARDMSLVTPENVSTRGGWKVTATGRLIRPLRMRPAHPLPATIDAAKSKSKGKTEKGKKRIREPPTRALRRKIDPTKWGSQHLKGVFLENAGAFVVTRPRSPPALVPSQESDEEMTRSESESESEEEAEEMSEGENASDVSGSILPAHEIPALKSQQPSESVTIPKPSDSTSSVAQELVAEKSQSLGLLQSLFGDKEEWGGTESIGSDVDEMDQDELPGARPEEALPVHVKDANASIEVNGAMPAEKSPASGPAPKPGENSTQKTKLKDLFAPRKDDAGFSLLGHLDLDLELEDDSPFDITAPTPVSVPTQPYMSIRDSTAHSSHVAAFDASRPFFFPTDHAEAKGRVWDPTNWKAWFYRTDSPEAIRARWEETKGELTASWKRRHREAIKSRRRRGGGGEAD